LWFKLIGFSKSSNSKLQSCAFPKNEKNKSRKRVVKVFILFFLMLLCRLNIQSNLEVFTLRNYILRYNKSPEIHLSIQSSFPLRKSVRSKKFLLRKFVLFQFVKFLPLPPAQTQTAFLHHICKIIQYWLEQNIIFLWIVLQICILNNQKIARRFLYACVQSGTFSLVDIVLVIFDR